MYTPLQITHSPTKPFTDYSRWRLLVNDGGRHTWHYLKTEEQCAQWPQNYVDKFWLGMETVQPFSLRIDTCQHIFFSIGPARASSSQGSNGGSTEWL
jgi:hypothetical protein